MTRKQDFKTKKSDFQMLDENEETPKIERAGKAFFVPKDEIQANGYDLSINRYKEVEYEEVNYEMPKVILEKLRTLEEEIKADLDVLEDLLS